VSGIGFSALAAGAIDGVFKQFTPQPFIEYLQVM